MKEKSIFFALFFLIHQGFSQTITLTEIAGPFAWMIGFEMPPNDDRFYTIRQNGYIVIVEENDPGSNEITFLDISNKINLEGEQGLLGLAFHPEYATNGYFYVYYCAADTKKSTLARYSRSAANPDFADADSEIVLLSFDQPTIKHNGGCLQFGSDGYLYLSSGDGGELNDPQNNGQKPNTYLGKILRLDVNNGDTYTIPEDNPFSQVFGYFPEIWSLGLRNPWRFSFDRLTGDLWISDVGQDEWEEVMFQPAEDTGGHNYGWSCREGTSDFNSLGCIDPDGFVNPSYQYPHSGNPDCSGSITGGYVYRGMANGDLFGKYIYTDFCTGNFTALTRDGLNMTASDLGTFNAFDYISFSENSEGELFVISYFSGRIFRIESTDCAPTAHILIPGEAPVCPGDTVVLEAYATDQENYNFQWQQDEADLPNATGSQLSVTAAGNYQVVVTNLNNGCTAISAPVSIEFGDSYSTTLSETICEGDSLEIYGQIFSESGTHTFPFLAENGCDSTVILTVNTLPNASNTLEINIAPNTYYEGILIEHDTIVIQNHIAENGCDSLLTIYFSILINETSTAQSAEAFSIAPNLVTNGFYLKKPLNVNGKMQYAIYNHLGIEVTERFSFDEENNFFTRKNTAKGVYFMVVHDKGQQFNLRFVCL